MATYLDIRTYITTCEQAVVDAVSLGLQWRQPAVSDVAALSALTSVGQGNVFPDRALRYVQSEGVVYRWKGYSNNVEALPYVVLPSDRSTTSRGRWERQVSTVTMGPNYYAPVHRVQTGYAKAVQLWEGNEDTEEMRERIFGMSPAFLIRWVDDELTLRGSPPNGIHETDLRFEVWCFSRNYRPERESLEGSPFAAEAAADPGLFRMMGDLRYLLAGTSLGLSPGVRYVDIQGKGEILHEEKGATLRESRFIGKVPILVKASLNIPDEDLTPLSEIAVQFQTAQVPVSDVLNHVAKGYGFNVSSGLVATPDPGVAYIAGQVKSSTPGAHLFAASMDTYRDLTPDGQLVYVEVPIGTPAENVPQTSGSLRIGVTRTNDTDIIGDAFLCDVVVNYGEQFVVKTG